MKKKLIAILIGFIGLMSLASCTTTRYITKVTEDAEYTKISNTVTEVYEKVSKGCVGISVSNSTASGSGSGVIYKFDSETSIYYVVTNAHVVEDMSSVHIYFGDNVYNPARVVGYDTKNDIAVLTFTLDLLNQSLKDEIYINDFFHYEDLDLPTVGESVLAIGCPLGLEFYNILTTGVVSSVTTTTISTDAAINPGNSGGGLFNLEGRMIGINAEKEVWTSSTSDSGLSSQIPVEGRGFAIGLDVVKQCITDIEKANSIVTRPLLGVTVATVNTILNPNSEYKQYLPAGETVCFIVTDFAQVSAGRNCGILLHDVLVEINDQKINQASDISDVLNSILLTDSVKLKVYRITNGQATTVDITVTF